jgi:rhodanese-related sulfurtransferase
MKFRYIFLIATSFVILSCRGQESKKIQSVNPETFAKKIKETKNAQILDVRTPEEFASEHIANAANVNWLADDFAAKSNNFYKSKPIFVYCKSGARSQKASEKLAELGFKNIYTLEGGLLKWNAVGFSKPTTEIIGMSSQEYAKLLNSDKKVLIDFYAEWCAPCKKMESYLLKMQKELGHRILIIRLDADKNKTLLSEMKINELPTLLLYENKEIKWKHSGFISEVDLKKQLQ